MGAYFHSRPYTNEELQRRALRRYTTAQEHLDAALDTARTAPAGTDPMTAILQAMTEAGEADADLRAVMDATAADAHA